MSSFFTGGVNSQLIYRIAQKLKTSIVFQVSYENINLDYLVYKGELASFLDKHSNLDRCFHQLRHTNSSKLLLHQKQYKFKYFLTRLKLILKKSIF